MPITVQLPASAAECFAFAASPALEALLSLHVLVEPKHHSLQHPWVRRMQRLPPSLKREIDALGFAYRSYFPAFLFPTGGGVHADFAAEAARLRAVEPDQAREEFAIALLGQDARGATPVEQIRLLARRLPVLADDDVHLRTAVTLAIEDPGRLTQRLAHLLEGYWEEAFAQEWERIEPVLAEGISAAGRLIAERGVYAFLAGMRPDIQVDPARRRFQLARPHDHALRLDPGEHFVLTPSVYVWPHARVNCDQPWPLGLVFPAPFITRRHVPQLPPADLVALLRALADETRLRVVRYIAERPRSTQELAPLVSLSEATLSKHLRALAAAGVVSTRREGYYVLYQLVPERLEGLHESMGAFIGTGPPSDTDLLFPQ
jgi:DNA-binding transcriptional ArsR family regulator